MATAVTSTCPVLDKVVSKNNTFHVESAVSSSTQSEVEDQPVAQPLTETRQTREAYGNWPNEAGVMILCIYPCAYHADQY
jgi:hypothetical protein